MKDYRQQENGFMRHNQNRRSRGRNSNNNNRKGPNPLTRSYESNGPDVKVRGTAMHVAEKYMTLARDAQSSGDNVAAENYLQHAEHYNRIVMAAQAQFQQAQQAQFRDSPEEGYDEERQMNGRAPRDRFDFNGDGGRDEEEGDDRFDSTEEEQERAFQPQPRPGPQRQDDRGPRGPRPDRNDRFDRRDRPDRNERGPRPDGDRGMRAEGDRGMRPEGDRSNRPDADRPRPDADRGPRPERFERGGDRPERSDRAERIEHADRPEERDASFEQPLAAADAPAVPLAAGVADEEAAPARRRRGRPPRAENGAAPHEPDDGPGTTPDGAAALVAFPD
jgi:hypothetical protein